MDAATVISIDVAVEPHGAGLPLPQYETDLAAGMDLRAALHEAVTLLPGKRTLVPTGLRMALPPGFEAQVRPRSGLALRHGVTLVNTPGTIDADYRGEIKVLMINHGEDPFTLQRGERIAQLVIAPVARAKWRAVGRLEDTARGTGGFGHTGR